MTKSKLVRITGPGIFGAPTKDNPTGEIPVGTEFPVLGDLPAGWKGRAVFVGKEPAAGSVAITNEEIEKQVAELTAQHETALKAETERADAAEKQVAELTAQHETALKAETERADAAEKQVAELTARVAELEKANEPPALSGKNKAELLEIAAKEGVTVEDGATNDDIKAAIELKREAEGK